MGAHWLHWKVKSSPWSLAVSNGGGGIIVSFPYIFLLFDCFKWVLIDCIIKCRLHSMLWQFQMGGPSLISSYYLTVLNGSFKWGGGSICLWYLHVCSMHCYFLISSYYLTVSNGHSLTTLKSVEVTQCSGSFKWGGPSLISSYYLTVSNGCSLTILKSVEVIQCSGSFEWGRGVKWQIYLKSANFELTCHFMLCFTEGLFILNTKDLINTFINLYWSFIEKTSVMQDPNPKWAHIFSWSAHWDKMFLPVVTSGGQEHYYVRSLCHWLCLWVMMTLSSLPSLYLSPTYMQMHFPVTGNITFLVFHRKGLCEARPKP